MDKYIFHTTTFPEYPVIVTILDYEIQLRAYLSEITFPSCMRGKKALVDMALKTGIDEYRFVCFDVDDNGKINFDSNNYITVSEDMENIANMFLKQRKDIVLSSFLTDSQKKRIICC